jgi:hypothetical protein
MTATSIVNMHHTQNARENMPIDADDDDIHAAGVAFDAARDTLVAIDPDGGKDWLKAFVTWQPANGERLAPYLRRMTALIIARIDDIEKERDANRQRADLLP